MRGIAAYGAYVPYWRLDRKAIATALGAPSGSGTRSVASYDEDTTSLGVEAARAAVRAAPHLPPGVLYFATAQPAYLDKTNATAIHAALDLAPSTPAYDMAGAVRSGAGALGAALEARRPALAVLSDIRTGLPGGADEREGGDGGVAFLCCEDTRDARVLAEPVAFGSATAEFLERWRLPGEPASRQWEERFGEHVYVPLGESAVTEALKQAGVTAPSITQWVIAGPHARAAKRLAASLGATKGSIVDDLATVIGNTGTAHAGVANHRGEVVDDASLRRTEGGGEALGRTRVGSRDHPLGDGRSRDAGLFERFGDGALAERDVDVLAETLLPLPRGRLAGQPPALEEFGRGRAECDRLGEHPRVTGVLTTQERDAAVTALALVGAAGKARSDVGEDRERRPTSLERRAERPRARAHGTRHVVRGRRWSEVEGGVNRRGVGLVEVGGLGGGEVEHPGGKVRRRAHGGAGRLHAE